MLDNLNKKFAAPPRLCLLIVLTLVAVSATSLSRSSYADDEEGTAGKVRKIELAIDAARSNIIEESKAIKAGRQRLKEASRLTDKTMAAQIKDEAAKDIEKREAAIKNIKKDIINKKYERNDLVYGKQIIPKRSEETRY